MPGACRVFVRRIPCERCSHSVSGRARFLCMSCAGEWLNSCLAHYNWFAMTNVTMSERWTGLTVDGKYPLVTWLGGSARCGVFATELRNGHVKKATIKLMPALDAELEHRTRSWAAAQELKHPHLLRVLEWGRCRFDGAELAYVVAEFAPEVLAQILPERALSADETRTVLAPLLEVLTYLHGLGLVHGHLKPANILADGDDLKLAVDRVLRADEANGEIEAGEFAAPELARGEVTAAADVWSLGVTLVEMLTQKPPAAGADGEMVVPEGVPEPFGRIARACLRVNPAERCGLEEIRVWLAAQERVEAVAAAEPVATEALGEAVAARPRVEVPEERGSSRDSRMWIRMVALVALLTVMAAAWYWLRPHRNGASLASEHPGLTVPQENPVSSGAEPPATSKARPSAAVPAVGASAGGSGMGTERGAVLERFSPKVLPSALATIHGTVRVDVRVTAGSSGRVADAAFAEHGPSRYFADAAMKAARQWRFEPAKADGQPVESVWLLKFEFTRGGSEMAATEVKP